MNTHHTPPPPSAPGSRLGRYPSVTPERPPVPGWAIAVLLILATLGGAGIGIGIGMILGRILAGA